MNIKASKTSFKEYERRTIDADKLQRRRKIAQSLGTIYRMECMEESEMYITAKLHKEDFPLKCVMNPLKLEI